MVRVTLVFFLFIGFLQADSFEYAQQESKPSLKSKIINLIGEDSYVRDEGFINILFSPSSAFYKNNRVDTVRVMQILIENKLFHLKLPSKRELKIYLKTDGSATLFVKLMKDSLRNLGYYGYKTLSSDYDGKDFIWGISFETSKIPNIIKIGEQLSKVGATIVDIEHIGDNEWRYSIDISHSIVESVKISGDSPLVLKHSLDPYWIDIRNVKTVNIKSSRRNSWHPHIVFFDADLKLIEVVKEDKRVTSFFVEIPQEAIYMKIADIYTMKNIRDSLSLYPRVKR